MIFELIPIPVTKESSQNETPRVGLHLAYHFQDGLGRRLVCPPMQGHCEIDETFNTLIIELEKLRKLAKQYVS